MYELISKGNDSPGVRDLLSEIGIHSKRLTERLADDLELSLDGRS